MAKREREKERRQKGYEQAKEESARRETAKKPTALTEVQKKSRWSAYHSAWEKLPSTKGAASAIDWPAPSGTMADVGKVEVEKHYLQTPLLALLLSTSLHWRKCSGLNGCDGIKAGCIKSWRK